MRSVTDEIEIWFKIENEFKIPASAASEAKTGSCFLTPMAQLKKHCFV